MNDTTTAKGFFQTLFDFDFETFLTLKFLKVIYAIFTGLLLLGGAIWLVLLISTGETVPILMALFLVPVITLVYLVLTRISFELVALFFRIGENTSTMARSMAGGGVLPAAGPGGHPAAPAVQPSGPAPGRQALGGSQSGPAGRPNPGAAGQPGPAQGPQGGSSPFGGDGQNR